MLFSYNSELLKLFKKVHVNRTGLQSYQSNDSLKLSTPTLVIAINRFIANRYDQLDIYIGEFLIVTDWNYKNDWVYGHRKNNEKEKGIFPKTLVKICNGKNKGLIFINNIYILIKPIKYIFIKH